MPRKKRNDDEVVPTLEKTKTENKTTTVKDITKKNTKDKLSYR